MKKYLLALNLLILFLSACKKDVSYPTSANDLLSFAFTSQVNSTLKTSNVSCSISDSVITGMTDAPADLSSLVATFTTSGAVVTVNYVVQVSGVTKNDFTKPVIYVISSQDGQKKQYTARLSSFTGLPVLYITTEGPVVSEEDYVNGTMKIDGNMLYTDGLYDGKIQIRGRGNSTWLAEKKPYKIKFDSKAGLFGMPADKEWALLANYYDKSLLRNDVAFEISQRLGAAWTPRGRFVEVFLNGQYNGSYQLTETVKESNDRVAIDDKNDGWLVEIDHNASDGDPRFYIAEPTLNIVTDVKEGTLDPTIIKSQLDNFYYTLNSQSYGAETGYQSVFDLDSYVTWYIVNEVMINNDAAFYSSVFVQKDNAAAKIKMGPVWDFDLSSGNVSTGQVSPEGWYIRNSVIANRLSEDPAFLEALKIKWNKYKSQITSIDQYIDLKSKSLDLSASENFKRWDILNVVLPNTVSTPGTYQGEVDYFKDWLNQRIKWMDTEINK